MQRNRIPVNVDMLSREAYGEGLAEWLWDEFTRLAPDNGIYHGHAYYCGIGLIRTEEGAAIHHMEDGQPLGPPRVGWGDRESFVRYWVGQSDYGLSGADPLHPEIIAASDFELNNQRINRTCLHEFLEERHRMRAMERRQQPR